MPTPADRQLRARARQQAAIADFGRRALEGMEVDDLLRDAVSLVARELDADFVSILELLPGGEALRIRVGEGWPDGVVGATIPADPEELQGHALATDGPVLSQDLSRETRFRRSSIQVEQEVLSVVAVLIRGRAGAFGLLGAHSRRAGRFSDDDALFLRAIANTVGAAVERARVEAGLRESEALFRGVADSAPVLLWVADASGGCTFFNDGWLRFTGRPLEDELGDGWADGVHADDLERCLSVYRGALERREGFEMEYRLRRHDGEYRWLFDHGVPLHVGEEFTGFIGSCIDIHDRKEMENELRVSEAAFRELADNAPVMIWTTDEAGLVTFVNRGWLEFTGTALEDELGPSWSLGVHPDDADEVLRSWLEALGAREPWEREYRLRHRDGSYRWILDRGAPRFDGGRFAGYAGIASDIHERRQLEESLRQVYEQEHRIAETLQRSLLPAKLPEIDGVELAARYLPAGPGAAVGGDWYDAIELPDGRVALVVGDVVGHGLRAAAIMGQLRNAFRAYALIESSPAQVVARMNRLLLSGDGEGMATVLCLVLDRETGEVTFASAGHPPPLLITPDGTRFLEGGRSVPIGAADPVAFREAADTIPSGATMLLYTDGLVERRDVGLEDRLAQLAAVGRAAGGELSDVCDQVLSALLGTKGPADDVALLAVRPDLVGAARLALSLPADPEALRGLRRRLTRFLRAAGASTHETYEITLAISEAASNAVEHAYGPGDAAFAVEAAFEDGEVVAAVRDQGKWREQRGDEHGRGLKIIDGLMESVEVAREGGGTVVRMRRRLGVRAPA